VSLQRGCELHQVLKQFCCFVVFSDHCSFYDVINYRNLGELLRFAIKL